MMHNNDAIEQAYRNGYEEGNKAGYNTGRRYGVCEFEAYLFAWSYAHGDIKIDDLPKLRESYLELVDERNIYSIQELCENENKIEYYSSPKNWDPTTGARITGGGGGNPDLLGIKKKGE